MKFSRLVTSGLAVLATGCVMQAHTTFDSADLANYPTATAQGAIACSAAMRSDAVNGSDAPATLDPEYISLFVWNIHKNKHADALTDLAIMAGNSDLVLLQEASLANVPDDNMQNAAYWSFAPGFRTSELVTGVMTISSVQPLTHCILQDQEPWLRTPKAINITKFALTGSQQTLAVVNIHGVNFTIGVSDFGQQLEKIRTVIDHHDGPVIIAGDFNTWNNGRDDLVEQLSAQLGMTELFFCCRLSCSALRSHARPCACPRPASHRRDDQRRRLVRPQSPDRHIGVVGCQMRPNLIFHCLAVVAVLIPTAHVISAEPAAEIEHLLHAIGQSDCVFTRNGTDHSATDAENHLRMKYNRTKSRIKTAETFIDRLATESSWTGKPYTIRCAGGEATPSGEWLSRELTELRQE